MESGATPRCVIVAAHAGRNRTGEYFPGYDPAEFSRHEHFFLDELPAWAEATLGVAAERAQRAVFGCSDGGAHAVFHAAHNPERFGHAIAYSSGLPPNGVERWADGTAPFIQLCAGIYEGQFHTSTYAWHAYLSMTDVEHHWTERVCGHEFLQWIEELPDALARAFGPS
jgi:enterochelin esterase-like enzyme